MKKNLGIFDILIRLFVSVVLFDIAANKSVPGYWNILVWVLAGVILLTVVLSWCPLYALFGFHTNQRKDITHQ